MDGKPKFKIKYRSEWKQCLNTIYLPWKLYGKRHQRKFKIEFICKRIDSFFTYSDTYLPIPFTAGEQLDITLARIDTVTTTSTITALQFFVKTTKSYTCINAILRPDISLANAGVNINFANVFTPKTCDAGTGKALTYFILFNGLNNLTINFNNTKYSGSIVREGNKYVVKWPYTSGVVISPTSL